LWRKKHDTARAAQLVRSSATFSLSDGAKTIVSPAATVPATAPLSVTVVLSCAATVVPAEIEAGVVLSLTSAPFTMLLGRVKFTVPEPIPALAVASIVTVPMTIRSPAEIPGAATVLLSVTAVEVWLETVVLDWTELGWSAFDTEDPSTLG